MDKCNIPDLGMEKALEGICKMNEIHTSKAEKEPLAIPGQNLSCTVLIFVLSTSPEKNSICLSLAPTSSAWYSQNADLEFLLCVLSHSGQLLHHHNVHSFYKPSPYILNVCLCVRRKQ